MSYDLLLKGGHIIDPGQGLDGTGDVAFAGGRVARVAPSISASDASEVRDVSGFYVVPGLIDLHTHVYWGSTYLGVDADAIAPAAGMTTAVDAGSAGAGTVRGLVAHVAQRTNVRVLAFVNLSFIGIITGSRSVYVPEAEDLRLLSVPDCASAVRNFPDHAVGIKIRVGASSTAHLGAMPLHMAIRASELADDVPVMVHVGADMPPRIEDIVEPLRRGDILTHYCTPKVNSPLTARGALRDCMLEARRRGVVMDVGHGSGSFGFDVARTMLDLGFGPDVISSDVHVLCVDGPAFDVLVSMSKFLCLGVPLVDVVRAATATPAAVIRRPDLGTLRVGAPGDAALLELRREPVRYVDSIGQGLDADRRLVSRGLVLGGRWWCGGADRFGERAPRA